MSVIRLIRGRTAVVCMLLACAPALAQDAPAAPEPAPTTQAPPPAAVAISFDIPAQSLNAALIEFGRQSGQELLYDVRNTADKTSSAISGDLSRAEAMAQLLQGTGLAFDVTESGGMVIDERAALEARRAERESSALLPPAVPSADELAAEVAEGPTTLSVETARRGGIEEIIVTGQKREERIQDVPIAISAFSMKDLDDQKIEGGFDLLKAVPNVTFSKSNFSGYNFQIRGIGTQAVSATTDPGVAVSFNNTTLIVNRLFEQEYLDIERVEVLRGPQGTLYGRNATAGVINVISAKPKLGEWEGELKMETGNYAAQRLRGHYNIPLGDTLAARVAGAWTKRDGYGTNEAATDESNLFRDSNLREDVDGRDLWTGRITLGWEPTDRIRMNLMWERFKEDDNRVRTSKQLCHYDEGPRINVAGSTFADVYPEYVTEGGFLDTATFPHAPLSQGCKPGSLYADEAYGTPNAAALPYVNGLFSAANAGVGDLSGSLNGYFNRATGDGSLGVGVNPWHPNLWATPGVPPADIPCEPGKVNALIVFWGNNLQQNPVDSCHPNPYRGRMQSRDMRTIYSPIEPVYRADADIFELSFDIDLDNAVFSSQTVYTTDEYYASQDYNRFTSFPLWTDTATACGGTRAVGFIGNISLSSVDCSNNPNTGRGTFAPLTDRDGDGIVDQTHYALGTDPMRELPRGQTYTVDGDGYVTDANGGRVGFYRDLAPGGVFCDPQLGCSDSLLAQDLSKASSKQFNQEFRLVSGYDGPFNFSIGANFTRFETTNDYYVFINALSYLTQGFPFNSHTSPCATVGYLCRYVDPNPIGSINDEGHNYFRSSNPYQLTSSAIFGESYWNITDSLKLTTGLRFTWDKKVFTPVASQLLLADYREVLLAHEALIAAGSAYDPNGIYAGGVALQPGQSPTLCNARDQDPLHCPLTGSGPGGRGFVADADIVQTWREPTGRIVLDWKPDLASAFGWNWLDESLVYISVARGYKGGGANPPSVALPSKLTFDAASGGLPDTFKPEYVNAVEIGTKNTLFGGGMTLNMGAFYYDYKDYQVSKIADRRAVNENFDAAIWGLELEAMVAPTPDLLFNAAIGYLRTRVGDGEESIDLMDRTDGGNRHYINPGCLDDDAGTRCVWDQGFDRWTTIQPFVNAAALCVAPLDLVELHMTHGNFVPWAQFCPNGGIVGGAISNAPYYDENGNIVPSSRNYISGLGDAPNNGAGFAKDLSGHELPNAPRFTVSLGGQQTFYLPAGWDITGRVDWYWQDESWARVYNLPGYDNLKSWTNTNLSVWANKPDWGLKVELYVKNIFDETPITGTFLNSEDSGLTTNVFTLDPRLIGLSITKRF